MPAPLGSKFMAEALPLFSRMMEAHMLRPRLVESSLAGSGMKGSKARAGTRNFPERPRGSGPGYFRRRLRDVRFSRWWCRVSRQRPWRTGGSKGSLPDLLGIAQDARQSGRDVYAEVDGALDEFGAVELLEVVEELGNGDGGNLVALGTRHTGEAFEGEAHVARLVEDGLDGFVGLGIEVLGFVEQRRVAEDDGEGVVELAGHVAGELAETDELLGFDEFSSIMVWPRTDWRREARTSSGSKSTALIGSGGFSRPVRRWRPLRSCGRAGGWRAPR